MFSLHLKNSFRFQVIDLKIFILTLWPCRKNGLLMKFGQAIEHNKRNFFFENHTERGNGTGTKAVFVFS